MGAVKMTGFALGWSPSVLLRIESELSQELILYTG